MSQRGQSESGGRVETAQRTATVAFVSVCNEPTNGPSMQMSHVTGVDNGQHSRDIL